MPPVDRAALLLRLERQEGALVRALLREPALLDARGETAVRTAIALSRLHHLRVGDEEVELEPAVLSLRDETLKLLEGHRHRFFHERMDAALQAFAGDPRLEEKEGRNDGELGLLPVEHLPVVVVEGDE